MDVNSSQISLVGEDGRLYRGIGPKAKVEEPSEDEERESSYPRAGVPRGRGLSHARAGQ